MTVLSLPEAGFGPAAFLCVWPLGRALPDEARLAALIGAAWGADAVAGDTLGLRNQRSLMLHRALCPARIEARVICPECAADNEAELPVDDLLAVASPQADVTVQTAQGPRRFGVPRLSELDALAAAAGGSAEGLVERLALDDGGPVDAQLADAVAAAWEAADPAGAISLELTCSECHRTLTASVEPAIFVARDLDLLADRLMREVDTIARAYGWSEAAILALPPDRRRRYVALAAMTTGQGGGA